MESYITLEKANEYFMTRLNNEDWNALTDEKKQACLYQATQIIDSKNYLGTKTDPKQALKFPRKNLIYDGVVLPSDEIPTNILQATCELATQLINSDVTASNDLAQFGKVKLGVLEIETKDDISETNIIKTLPPLVNALLKPFMFSSVRLYRG